MTLMVFIYIYYGLFICKNLIFLDNLAGLLQYSPGDRQTVYQEKSANYQEIQSSANAEFNCYSIFSTALRLNWLPNTDCQAAPQMVAWKKNAAPSVNN
jgi:hypothetical protein